MRQQPANAEALGPLAVVVDPGGAPNANAIARCARAGADAGARQR